MVGHTKGPWWADGLFVYLGEDGPPIAQMYGASDPEIRPQREDNARLIAAAPCLLEALMLARELFVDGNSACAEICDEAIAKANQP